MIKLLVKLAIAAFVANAAWRLGSEYLTHAKFRDAVREAAMYDNKGEQHLRQKILDVAAGYEIPIDESTLTIETEDRHTIISGSYVKPIEFIPGHPYPWHFDWSIDAYSEAPPPPK